MNQATHQFLVRVAQTLGACQSVELHLKVYISSALELAKKCIGSRMVFNMSGDDFKEAPLERLIQTFRKLSDNPALAQRLNVFKDERNFVAHRVVVSAERFEGGFEAAEMSAMEARLMQIEQEAKRLEADILDESHKFLGHLYFGFDDEKG
jgi:hypothetical protein